MHPELIKARVQQCRDHEAAGDQAAPLGLTEEQWVALVLALAPTPPAQVEQADAAPRFWRNELNVYDDTTDIEDLLISIDGGFESDEQREQYAAWVLDALNVAARKEAP
jgi:hypothetical protein